MAEREYDYIKGNTVTAPQRKHRVRTPNKRNKQIQKKNHKKLLLKNKHENDQKYILLIVTLIFSIGLITIFGDSKVYNMQKQISDLNSQINQTNQENEALKVKLLKFSSLSNIQGKAGNQLAMYIPKKEETVNVDFSQNYFEDLKSKSSQDNAKKSDLFSNMMGLVR